MSDPFIGEIRIFAGKFAPRSWAYCSGEFIAISQNRELWTIIGNVYGGDGKTTFALPPMEGRTPVGCDEAADNPNPAYKLGAYGGEPSVMLDASELPPHNHTLVASSSRTRQRSAAGAYLGSTADELYAEEPAPTLKLAPLTLASAGEGKRHENRQPSLAISFIICLDGMFPAVGDPESK